MMTERSERAPCQNLQHQLPSQVYDLACVYLALVFIVGFTANGSVTAIFIKRKKVESRPAQCNRNDLLFFNQTLNKIPSDPKPYGKKVKVVFVQDQNHFLKL